MQSKKDWEDEFDEVESIYKFPYPENIGDAKCDPSESLSIILTTPIKMHKTIARSRKTYSKSAINPIIGLGEKEKLVIDSQLKNKSSPCRTIKKIPKTETPINLKDVIVGSEAHNNFAINLSKAKSVKSIYVKTQSNTSYLRTRKNLKRKAEEIEIKSTVNSIGILPQVSIQNVTDFKLPKVESIKPYSKLPLSKNIKNSKLPIDKDIKSSKLPEIVANLEGNLDEESDNLNLNFQPPPPAQKLSLMALVQKYTESIDPSQPVKVKTKTKKPSKEVEHEKAFTVSKESLDDQESNNSSKSNEKGANCLFFSEPCEENLQTTLKEEENSNLIPFTQRIVSHMSMGESLIESCKRKLSNSQDSTALSSEGNLNFDFIESESGDSLIGKNTPSIFTTHNSCSFPSNSVKKVVKRTTVSVKKKVISREKCDSKPDFQIQHRTSYLQSADFFCAFMGEVDALKKGSVSVSTDDTSVCRDVTVRQFCSSSCVNDAFSEILRGSNDISDPRSPNICYEFPEDLFDKPFQSVLLNYVDWLLNIMIPCKNNMKDSYFSSKYILEFSYKHMSYQECAIMSMVFNDPTEHLKLPSIVAKLSFVGMGIIFNAYLKKTCNTH